MFKNMKLGTKLIVVGTIIMVIPVVVIGVIAVSKSTKALKSIEYEQMGARSKELALSIDNVFKGEMKLVTDLSVGNSTISATTAVVEKGAENVSEEVANLNKKLIKFNKTRGLGEDYQVVLVTGLDGKIYAASKENYIGVSLADRGYFRDAISGRVNIGQPALNKVTGEPFVPVAAPIYSPNGKIVGMVANIIDARFLNDLIANAKIGETGYAYMVDKTGLMIAHPVKKHIFNLNITKLEGMETISNKMTAGQSGVENYVFEGIPKTCGYAPVELPGWSIGLTLPDEEFLAPVYAVRNIVIVIGIIFFIAAFLIFFFFARSVTKPINRIIESLSEGAEQVASASGQISSASQSLAEGASEQASSLEETSSSLEEMSSMTRQNADNANQANNLMKDANQVVKKANDSMQDLTTSMEDISKASEETQKIIKTIDEIAFQTNLLALNAAVEAARAGEAGAGFAVVAEEVRNLSMRSADAAKNTAGLIEGTVKKVKDGSQLVTRTNEAFTEVATSSSKVGELLSEIAAASQEQAQGIEQVNKAVVEMDKTTQQNAANAEESASASEEMNAQAEQIKGVVGDLRALVGGNGNKVGSKQYAVSKKDMTEGTRVVTGTRKTIAVPVKKVRKKEVKPDEVIPMASDPGGTLPLKDEADFKDF